MERKADKICSILLEEIYEVWKGIERRKQESLSNVGTKNLDVEHWWDKVLRNRWGICCYKNAGFMSFYIKMSDTMNLIGKSKSFGKQISYLDGSGNSILSDF